MCAIMGGTTRWRTLFVRVRDRKEVKRPNARDAGSAIAGRARFVGSRSRGDNGWMVMDGVNIMKVDGARKQIVRAWARAP
jgi:hypothetical protein